MSLLRSYSVYCDAETHADRCPYGVGYYPTSKDARAEAKRRGWYRDASAGSALDRIDLSPECAKAQGVAP